MNIVIPLGGIGSRFKDYGYIKPKPLVKAAGKEIILRVVESLKINKKDNFFIIYNNLLEDFNFSSYFKNHNNIHLIKLPHQTKGPLETVFFLKNILNYAKYKKEPLLIVDGDTFYKKNILKILRNKKNHAIFYSYTEDKNPIYSYIIFNKKNFLTDIKEKIKISNFFNTGAYFFKKSIIFIKIAEKVLKKNKTAYISDMYKVLLYNNILIDTIYLKKNDFFVLGTPAELINFSNSSYASKEKKRFCFDLDNTLVTSPKKKGDYDTCDPINKNIRYLNSLKNHGHYVIIYTARRMKTFEGNLTKVKKNIKQLTIRQLKNFSINYDELIFGKPYANFYIDDLAINADSNLDFELGFYDDYKSLSRVGNNLLIGEKITRKSSKSDKINFESKFLTFLPVDLKNYFPRILSRENLSYTMETIHGVNFQRLAQLNLLNEKHLTTLLNVMDLIHKKIPQNIILGGGGGDSNLYYENYLKKFLDRKKLIDKNIVKKYSPLFNDIEKSLLSYENKKLAEIGLIHGDPVFSNIMYTRQNKIILLDPRGCHGDKFSMYGDINYDYAKIYQSLTGYEFILNEMPIPEKIYQLKFFFENRIKKKIDLDLIKKLTKSLYISLIPLHNKINPKKIIEFLIKNF